MIKITKKNFKKDQVYAKYVDISLVVLMILFTLNMKINFFDGCFIYILITLYKNVSVIIHVLTLKLLFISSLILFYLVNHLQFVQKVNLTFFNAVRISSLQLKTSNNPKPLDRNETKPKVFKISSKGLILGSQPDVRIALLFLTS